MKTNLFKVILLISTLLLFAACDFSSGSSSSSGDATTPGSTPPVTGDPGGEDPGSGDPGEEDTGSDDDDTDTDDSTSGGTTTSEHNASFVLTLSSYAKTDNSQSPQSSLFSLFKTQSSATRLVEGKILAVNQGTGAEQTYNWALEIDEGSLEISTEVSLPLDSGVYDFYFLMSSDSYQYAAITDSWIILDGDNVVTFMIHPVIGEEIPDINILKDLAEFQFRYDKNVVSEFEDPSFGIAIDDGNEHKFKINPDTGLSSTFVYLPAGTYDFELNFYDGSFLKSVLLDGQTTITITDNGGTINLEIVPLIFENTYTYNSADNSAEFNLLIPDNVIDEVGGVQNVEARFSLISGEKSPVEAIVSLTDNDAFYEGTITVTDFVPGSVTWAINIADISDGNNDVYAYCGQEIELTGDPQTLSCDFLMLASSQTEVAPAGELTVNVATHGYPISGAVVFVDGRFVGLTTGADHSAPGQLSILLPADSYTITAKSSDGSLIITTNIRIESEESLTLDMELPPPPNSQPQAKDINAETLQENAVTITLPGSDPDPWDTLFWSQDRGPADGVVSFKGNIATYTPNNGFSGTDSFTFFVSDGDLDSDPATATIQVTADPPPVVNHAPVASDLSMITDQDTETSILLDATDKDNDDLVYKIGVHPDHGAVRIIDNIATYIPETGFYGSDSFEYYAFDGSLESNYALVTVTVNEVISPPVNNPPVAEDIYVTLDQDQVVEFTLLGSDPDGDEGLIYTIKTQPMYGSVSISGNIATLTPDAGYFGLDSFTYQVNDTIDTSVPATVSLTILEVVTPPVNVAPEVDDLNITTDQDKTVMFDLIGYDEDGDSLEFSVDTLPQYGTVNISNGKATYSPTPGYFGSDGFTYTASDGKLTSDPGSVNLTVIEAVVIPDNTVPTTENIEVSIDQDNELTVTLKGFDPDVGAVLTYEISSEPANGTVSIIGEQAFYIPNSDFSGEDSFSYRVSDGMATSDPATVTITVNPVEPVPPVDEYVLTTSLSTWPWERIKDEIILDSPVKVTIPDHESLEVLEGNPDWFMLILQLDGVRCVYSGALHNASQWQGIFGWHGFKNRLQSPVCFSGKYDAGDEITVRKKIKAYLLTADPREDKTEVRITIDTVE